jgi:NagD protein
MSKYAYQPDIIVDSFSDLCDADSLLHDVLPTMNREDDTPHNFRDWVAGHS